MTKQSQSFNSIHKLGGVARAKKLSPKRRIEIAKKGSNARWRGHKPSRSN